MRWFAYVDNGKWKLNSLLSSLSIKEQLNKLPIEHAAFASIQSYDVKGKILNCPLYIDVDSSSLYDAWEVTKDTYCNLLSDFNIEPWLYFSGCKGFHIVMPFLIHHERCHEIAGAIAEDYCIDRDKAVYTKRRMWRCNGSINTKTGNYKIKVKVDWKLEDILKRSARGQSERHKEYKFKYYKNNLFNNLITEESNNLHTVNNYTNEKIPVGQLKDCMKALWRKTDWKEGERHNGLFLLARSTVKIGLDKEKALALFASHPYWGKDYPWSDVKKVVLSVHNSQSQHWQCKRGSDSELLTPLCAGESCFWHDNYSIKLREEDTCGTMDDANDFA